VASSALVRARYSARAIVRSKKRINEEANASSLLLHYETRRRIDEYACLQQPAIAAIHSTYRGTQRQASSERHDDLDQKVYIASVLERCGV